MWADELGLDPYSPPCTLGASPQEPPAAADPAAAKRFPVYVMPGAPATPEEVRKIVREELARVLRP